MRAKVIEDALIYVPNLEHKNFTESGKYLRAGEEIEGEPKSISGKRRGKDFKYRMFLLENGNLIHLNKVAKIELKSDIEGVNPKKIEKYTYLYSAVGGGLMAFMFYNLFKNPDLKTRIMIGVFSGLLGAMIDRQIETKN